jgi:serine/threonine-protein kinase
MELVEGRPLSDALREGKLDRKAALRILEKVARGVAAAHDKGVVHRDLKPSNILIPRSGEPKVADFGLAHLVDSTAELTRTGSSLGTPLYMSPEQVEGRSKEITPRTDVYSLGAILYEILTGRPPHSGETIMEIYGKILREDPPEPKRLDPKIPDELQWVALKALEKDPGRRYPTAHAFADDLARHLAGEPVLARPVGTVTRLYRQARRSAAVRALAVALAVGIVALLAVTVAGREKSRRLESEQEKRILLLRDHARLSLDAALKVRRAGSNAAMKDFLPSLEATYRQALESAPEAAEVEYLMGRMHRALLDDAKALDFQERALRKDPEYAPALYERAVLRANRYGSGLTQAVAKARRLPPGPVRAPEVRDVPLPDPDDVERTQEELLAVREGILRDCTVLEGILARRPESVRHVGEAQILTVKGILAFYRLEWTEARQLLEEAVRKDPKLEEAWAALCETVYRDANAKARRTADVEAAVRFYDGAERLHDQAIANDLGFVPHRIARADTRRHRAFILMGRGRDPLPAFDSAEADLTAAIQLNADFADAWLLRASVRMIKAVALLDRMKDATKEIEAAAEDLRTATARWGDRPAVWILQGQACNERARWRRLRREDPLPEYAAADQAFRRAVELDPLAMQASSQWGQTKMERGEYRSRSGADPLPDYAEAEKDFTEVIRASRLTAEPWLKRAQVRMMRGMVRLKRGEAPLDDFSQADEDFSEALRLSPAAARVWAERASARIQIARLRERSRETAPAAREAYAAAEADFGRGFELNPSLDANFAAEWQEAKKKLEELKP